MELLPCPFCGRIDTLIWGQGEEYFIECGGCYDQHGTTVCATGNARHDAVAMWNRRQSSATEAEIASLRAQLEHQQRYLSASTCHDALMAANSDCNMWRDRAEAAEQKLAAAELDAAKWRRDHPRCKCGAEMHFDMIDARWECISKTHDAQLERREG